jgi:predicted membrane protein
MGFASSKIYPHGIPVWFYSYDPIEIMDNHQTFARVRSFELAAAIYSFLSKYFFFLKVFHLSYFSIFLFISLLDFCCFSAYIFTCYYLYWNVYSSTALVVNRSKRERQSEKRRQGGAPVQTEGIGRRGFVERPSIRSKWFRNDDKTTMMITSHGGNQ